jgi:Rrf2 family protein
MLSKKTKYALNALVFLAENKDKGAIQIHDIAEHEHIPQKFLEAILLDLRKAGILSSKRGRGGGYYLLHPPKEINLADVIRHFEGALAWLPCVAHKYYEPCAECKDEATCGIRDVFRQLREETVRLLKGTSLQDVLDREKELKKGLK